MAKKRKISNAEVAGVLETIAGILDIHGENVFKVRAYERAANTIRSIAEDINDINRAGRLKDLPGIGKDIEARIHELLTTGRMGYFEEIRHTVPQEVLELMRVQGVGPKRAKTLFQQLNITTVDELKQAALEHKIDKLAGMGAKTEENILKSVAEFQAGHTRLTLAQAFPMAEEISGLLKRQQFVADVTPAGSLRRMKETIGDIDILAASDHPDQVMEFFCTMPEVVRVLARGPTKSSIVASSGLQVDLRVVPPDQWGSALQYFTGSKAHSIHLRDVAKKRGLKISEYGIFDVKTTGRLGGASEDDIYRRMGMDTPRPTLREDFGEIEAALAHGLPDVVEVDDIKGDLQIHSTWSDGLSHIEELAEKAREIGYSYIAVTDHAERLHIAGGMTVDEIKKRQKEIDALNSRMGGFRVLSGVELNIDNDGNGDYDDSVLELFEVVVGSIHSGFTQREETITKRMLKAMENPNIHIIAHPTGRIIGKRAPYALNMDKMFAAAEDTGTVLEINAFPDRLDLKDDYIREAKRRGLKMSINTDAHQAAHLRYMFYGVAAAQRGWAEPSDIINTRPVDEMLRMLK